MFVVLLRFAANKKQAATFMDAHQAWLDRGFADGVFLLAGSLIPSQGGGILASNTSRAELEQRVDGDPFVTEQVVSAEIVEIEPARAQGPFAALLE